ncbi:MAG: PD-(D/E)XK nuclease family protein [Candidatus Aenigmarchaeota archaeon]|nr:PD-(D/E)XK nuclease family protein [Candidatus Aenigmarchaeota archaeon]
MQYSHSRLSTFEQCPLRFKYHYIDEIEPPEIEESVEAFLGSRVHEALEKLYKDAKFQKVLALEELLTYYNEIWKKNWGPAIKIVKAGYTEENFCRMGEAYIEAYYKRHAPFNQAKTVGLEHKVLIELNGHTLLGFIDRLSYDPRTDTYEIHDYKTSLHLMPDETARTDRQLALYSIAVRSAYKTSRVKLIWHFLAFEKDVVIEKTDAELEELKRDTLHLIKRIEGERDFKPRVSALCDYCEFRPICPEWKHLYKVEDLPPSAYANDTGVQLVNRYVELQDKVKMLSAEQEEVKKALTEYAKREGVTAVAGSGFKARIATYGDLKIPKDREDDVRALLQEYNLWSDASRIDMFRLRDIVQSYPFNPDNPNDSSWKPWPPELIKRLAKLLKKEENVRVYVRKMDNE